MSTNQTPQLEPILSTRQMVQAEQKTLEQFNLTSFDLQELAGKAVASAAEKLKLDGGRFVFIVGPGNNGSDGFVAARLLRKSGRQVTVIPLFPDDKMGSDTRLQAERARNAGVKIRPAVSEQDLPLIESWMNRSVIIIDAVFGTGLKRPVEGWVAKAFDCINKTDRPILALDIPSGLDSDSGNTLGTAIQADFTLPIAAYKYGHWMGEGNNYSGKVLTPAPIQIQRNTIEQAILKEPAQAAKTELLNKTFIQNAFPPRHSEAHKKNAGHLWIYGGSHGFTGAPRLSAMGAMAVGTGLVSIACPKEVYQIIATQSLEVMVHADTHANSEAADTILAGPGWGKDKKELLQHLIHTSAPLVLDADALNLIAASSELQSLIKARKAITVMTPHPGEAARLLGINSQDIQADRIKSAISLCKKFHCWIVLKGRHTLIVSPEKEVVLNPFGSPNLAVAGTGDVLAGMIAGGLTGGKSPETIIAASVGLHALAGEQDNWHRAGELESIVARLVKNFQCRKLQKNGN